MSNTGETDTRQDGEHNSGGEVQAPTSAITEKKKELNDQLNDLFQQHKGATTEADKVVLGERIRAASDAFCALPGVPKEDVDALRERLRRNRIAKVEIPAADEPFDLTGMAMDTVATPALHAALKKITQDGRYTVLEELQTGNFATGYRAHTASGQVVVIKLPAASAWAERFDECAAALRREMQILDQVRKFLPDPDRATCARVIEQVGSGEIRVPDWAKDVPWMVHTFARGRRLWGSGLLPMRGEEERAGTLLLAQVIGLAHLLAQHGIAHRDFKPDALFWDAAADLVEVIDWNSARENPTTEEVAHEFSVALTSLVSEVWLGVEHPERDEIGYHLFTKERWPGLTRGARLLLARLLDPHFDSIAIMDVATLHAALQELARDWLETEQASMPSLEAQTPRALSAWLTRVAIAAQQADARADAGTRQGWYAQALHEAEKEGQKLLTRWLRYPDNLRNGLGKIEAWYDWLPDVWPLSYAVPLARAWFAEISPERDQHLAKVLHLALQRNWRELRAIITQLLPSTQASPTTALQEQMNDLAAVAEAYERLPEIETLLTDGQVAEAARVLDTVRAVVPLDAQVTTLERRIMGEMTGLAEVQRVRARIKALSQEPPSAQGQAVMLTLWEKLRVLGYSNQTEEQAQRAVVFQIKGAWQSYIRARAAWQNSDGQRARESLAQCNIATLRHTAPDLFHALKTLQDRVERRLADEASRRTNDEIARLYAAVEAQLQTGWLERAMTVVDSHGAGETMAHLPALEQVRQRLREALQHVRALLDEGYSAPRTGHRGGDRQIDLPPDAHTKLPTLVAIHRQAQQIALLRQQLDSAETADGVTGAVPGARVWQKAQAALTATEMPDVVRPAWRRLREAASERLRPALAQRINALRPGEALPPELAHLLAHLEPEDWRQMGLDTVLQQRQQTDLVAQLQAIQQGIDTICARLTNLPTKQQRPVRTARAESGNSPSPWQSGNWPTSWMLIIGGVALVLVLSVAAIVAFRGFGRGGATNRTAASVSAPTVESGAGSVIIVQPTDATGNELPQTKTPVPTPMPTLTPAVATITVNPAAIEALPTSLTLATDGDLSQVQNVALQIGDQRVELGPPRNENGTWTLTLSETLLSKLPQPSKLPVTVTLNFGAGFTPQEVQLGGGTAEAPTGLTVSIRGAGDLAGIKGQNDTLVVSENQNGVAVPVGLVLWQNPDIQQRDKQNNDHVVRPAGNNSGYVLLKNDDQVKILEFTNDHYFIEIVTNKADSDNLAAVVGQRGWMRRDFVDGAPPASNPTTEPSK